MASLKNANFIEQNKLKIQLPYALENLKNLILQGRKVTDSIYFSGFKLYNSRLQKLHSAFLRCNNRFKFLLKNNDIAKSMNKKGPPYDKNLLCESKS